MKNILVTGGNGFIGTNLVQKLLKDENNFIIILDNLSSSTKKDIFKKYVNLIFIKGNINKKSWWKNVVSFLPENEIIHEIYHLACPASPLSYMKHPLKTLDTNYVGTSNVLKFALKYNSKVLFTSTSEIYGNPILTPQCETYFGNSNTIGPRSCYDEGKRIAETLCYEYHKLGSKVVVARIFNTYGPYMEPNDGRVISTFITKTLSKEPIEIHGGEQTRSFCYIDDTVNALVGLMENIPETFEVLNVGNPHEITLNELAEYIKNELPELTKTYIDYREDDPMQRKPDISKIQKYISWNPNIKLEDGIKLTIKYLVS